MNARPAEQRPFESYDGRSRPGTATKRRTRRAPGEIRSLLLDAARVSFAEKGYARSTTRDIAARADVAEVLLFRNFGSKANLFAEAVVVPMVEFLREWVDLTDPSTDADTEDMQRQFIDSLYGAAAENRGLLLTFFATSVFEPQVFDGRLVAAVIQKAIDELAERSEQRLVRLGVDVSTMRVGISSRAAIGMVLAMALFDDWLMPQGTRRPSREVLVNELTRQVLYGGFNQRQPTASGSRPTAGAARTARAGRGARTSAKGTTSVAAKPTSKTKKSATVTTKK